MKGGRVIDKFADATASLPHIEVASLPAQDNRTLRGMVPPTNYTRVNTDKAPTPDAGASAQKTQAPLGAQTLPKIAALNEDPNMNMTSRPLIQDLVKEAIAKDAQRAKIAAEGARQMNLADETPKQASAESSDEQSVSTEYAMKLAAAIEFATPILVKSAEGPAAAPPEGVSSSNVSGSPPGPGEQGKGHAQPPKSIGLQKAVAGAATQLENTANHHVPGTQTTAMSGGKGKTAEAEPSLVQKNVTALAKIAKSNKTAFAVTDSGHAFDAADYGGRAEMHGKRREAREAYHKGEPGLGMYHNVAPFVGAPGDGMVGLPGRVIDALAERHHAYAAKEHEKGDNAWNPFGGVLTPTERERAFAAKNKKEASAPATIVDYFLQATKPQEKVAEDAINPAKITAGAAVPPDTSASGESGGAPVAGMPQGPRGLVGSNESAINYKKQTAYAPRKSELAQYFREPALTSATDKTLQQAFAHTGEAGVKISSAPQVKTAAARAILMKLAEGQKAG